MIFISFPVLIILPFLTSRSRTHGNYIVTPEISCSRIAFPNNRTYLIFKKLILIKLHNILFIKNSFIFIESECRVINGFIFFNIIKTKD